MMELSRGAEHIRTLVPRIYETRLDILPLRSGSAIWNLPLAISDFLLSYGRSYRRFAERYKRSAVWSGRTRCSTQRLRHCQCLGGAVDIDYFHLAARTAVCGEWFLSLQEPVESPLFAVGT